MDRHTGMEIEGGAAGIVLTRPEARKSMREIAFSAPLEHACELGGIDTPRFDAGETPLQT